jgi:hypothetical protein
VTHPKGRQPIGVNQPPYGGTDYPFVNPSSDVQYLLGDLYLSYEDDNCEFTYPFKISRLYGFDDAGTPGPANDHDIIIKDADGVTVFDSTAATAEYAERSWASRLLIIEWVIRATYDSGGNRSPSTGSAICRVTKHTEWSPEDSASTYSADFAPANGDLDARAYNKLPLRVRSILVGTTRIEGDNLQLESGNNVAIAVEPDALELTFDEIGGGTIGSRIDGGRFVNPVVIQAEPGDGLGRATACEGADPIVRLINGIGPDPCGNVSVDLGGCYRASPPVFRGPGSLYSVSMEATEAEYYSPSAFSWAGDPSATQINSKASLQLTNRCGPCCDCDYFVRTYKGLDRQWDRWAAISDQTEDARDLYKLNIARWLAQKECRESRPLRLVTVPEPQCKLAVGASFCNVTTCCLIPFQLRVTFEVFDPDGSPSTIDFSTVVCNQTTIEGSQFTEGREKYEVAGSWPVYDIYYDYADARSTSLVSFRVCIPNCTNHTVKITLTAHASNPADCENIPLTTVTVPDEILALWPTTPHNQTLALTTKVVPLSDAKRTSEVCECPPFDRSGG